MAESQFRPKLMVDLGGMPILWHIMKSYSHHRFNEFIICAGYKQHVMIAIILRKRTIQNENIIFKPAVSICN